MVEYVVVMIIQENGSVILEDVVDVMVLLEFRIGGLASNLSRTEKCFVVCISSREVVSRSDPWKSMSDSPLLNETISFSNRCLRVSLSTWLTMTCDMKR